ncbi:stage II sporulation protein B [Bacillus thermophilus]|uniref:Stage II sporulation protein B n=1 Tax=Siminovitchia thermophila TaxID=1245522 RepID=A0ABS2R1E3_9BACI|nr:hypothetical protein [Siminovitchia thermophila]MBM7713453.1 stage II sporulation protein B [Siminovitchia thermophila]
MAKKRKAGKQKMKVHINGQESQVLKDIVINDWTKAENETAAAGDKAETGDFDWVLPENKKNEPDVEYEPINTHLPKETNKKGPRHFFKSFSPKKAGVALSTVLAIVVGLAFGLFVYKLVVNSENDAQLTDASVSPAANRKAETANLSVKAPEMNTAVIQGGVFNTEEAAKAAVDKLSEKGIPSATIAVDGQNFLFIGVTADVSSARVWSQELATSGIDVYPKEFAIPEKEIKVGSEAESALLSDSIQIFQSLLGQASSAELKGAADPDELKQIGEKLGSISKNNEGSDGINDLGKYLTEAQKALLEFTESGGPDSLAKAQQALLLFLKTYHDLGQEPAA